MVDAFTRLAILVFHGSMPIYVSERESKASNCQFRSAAAFISRMLNSSSMLLGKEIALVGHMVMCPKCKGAFPILPDPGRDHSFMGNDTGVEGMRTACGAILIASRDYDQFILDNGLPEKWFGGFTDMEGSIRRQARAVRANSPATLMWYFQTPKTKAMMASALEMNGVASVHLP